MAQRALPAGTISQRAFFGLLEADGWAWAFLKALFWFSAIIFALGYIPDRAYYFTVFPTIDLGTNIISPINFCDGMNRSLPCPAPPGSVIPWDTSPAQLALPAGRTEAQTVQFGTTLFLMGGQTADGPTDSVLQTTVTTDGNLAAWTDGPKLPAPRADATVVSFNGAPYVIGGLGPDGKPTDTVFVGDMENGSLKGWISGDQLESQKVPQPNLQLPEPLAGAVGIPGASSIWVIGGRTSDGVSNKVYRADLDTTIKPPTLQAFKEDVADALRDGTGAAAPRADAVGATTGSFLWLLGGVGADGKAVDTVMALALDTQGEPSGTWATSTGPANLPAPRALAAGWTANEGLYVAGGEDASGSPTNTFYWTIPDASTGSISGWHELSETDLPAASAGAAPAIVGSYAFLIGGQQSDAPVASSVRASLAPAPPFFRLGLIGATIPALSIKGEIGQQLGYLSAAGAGTLDFIVLILIGLGFSHREAVGRLAERLSRGRYKAPGKDEYFD
ncbi:MAG TPA: hypothetical protein VFW92_06870 [Candidatus Limnocylindrales bacterium]|nr:hypothetical protein [Candidatus Limnocylindrales bacterium]